MTSKELVLKIHRDRGRADALALRDKAVAGTITDTEIIDSEEAVPAWSDAKNYTNTPAGSPFAYEGQVYRLLQPHDASANPSWTPANTPALWGLAHTTNPKRAKPWVDPFGTSGMYMTGECYRKPDGSVKRATKDNLVWDADAYPEGWEDVPDA